MHSVGNCDIDVLSLAVPFALLAQNFHILKESKMLAKIFNSEKAKA
jgi:hypothetical protein